MYDVIVYLVVIHVHLHRRNSLTSIIICLNSAFFSCWLLAVGQTSWLPIVDYIDRAYEGYLQDESKVDRTQIIDNRVHCLLYFINPTGRG